MNHEWELNLELGTLRGIEHRGDGRPVLALHGWLDNAASFTPLMEGLESHEHWVAVDLPGHGQSYHRPAGASYPFVEWLLDVDEIADALGWDAFDIVGHSMGAGIGALYAAARPSRVKNLLMIEGLGPLSNEEDATTKKLSAALTSKYRFQDRERLKHFSGVEEAAERWAQGFSKVSLDAARLLAGRGLEKIGDGFRWSADTRLKTSSLTRMSESQVLDLLRGSRDVPKLMVAGDDGMFQMVTKRASRIEALAPRQELTVPGGHHCHMDRPALQPILSGWRELIAP